MGPHAKSLPQDVVGAVLAGGESRRMGTEKPLLLFHGRTLLDRAVDLLAECFAEVIIVGPGENAAHASGQVRQVQDTHPGLGPLGGIQTALVSASGRAVFILACDMPLVTVELVGRLLLQRTTNADVVCARCRDCGAVEPLFALYEPTVLPTAQEQIARGDLRLRHLLNRLRVRWLDLDEPAHRLLANVNTPEDLASLGEANR